MLYPEGSSFVSFTQGFRSSLLIFAPNHLNIEVEDKWVMVTARETIIY